MCHGVTSWVILTRERKGRAGCGSAASTTPTSPACTPPARSPSWTARSAKAPSRAPGAHPLFGRARTSKARPWPFWRALQQVQRLDEAIAACTDAIAVSREIGERHFEGEALTHLGIVLWQARRWEEAAAAGRATLGILADIGEGDSEATARRALEETLRAGRRNRPLARAAPARRTVGTSAAHDTPAGTARKGPAKDRAGSRRTWRSPANTARGRSSPPSAARRPGAATCWRYCAARARRVSN
ncbi:tetratricopeptide repeat protein [Actinomadura litoris]|uniref:tetratricopeptide repeat protein n=1 Tax=Actinomadura litoris TaxID=2678616 RepID=UPI0035E447D2